MKRRPSSSSPVWHLDESHDEIVGTVKKSPTSRWFVGIPETVESRQVDGSSSCENAASVSGASRGTATGTSVLESETIQVEESTSSDANCNQSDACSDSSRTSNNGDNSLNRVGGSGPAMDLPAASTSAASPVTVRACQADTRRSSQERQRLVQMINDYNVHRGGRLGEIEIRDVDDTDDEDAFVFEGVLRVYWGVKMPIFISNEKVEDLSPQKRRRSKNISAKDLQSMSGGKRTWSLSANARRRIRSATVQTSEEVEKEVTPPTMRAQSLPTTGVITATESPCQLRRATVGEPSSVRAAADKVAQLSTSDTGSRNGALRRHQSAASTAARPTGVQAPRNAEVAIPEESESPNSMEQERVTSLTPTRRASEPAMPLGDTELVEHTRKARVQRSASTAVSTERWTGIMERAHRRAKRSSFQQGDSDSAKLNVEFFIPPHGSMSNLRSDSSKMTVEVIFDLLRKVNAIDEPSRFALFVVKDSGEVRRLRDDEAPLYRRLQLGPKEDLAKLWIMEATETASVSLSAEAAQFYNLSMPFLQKIVERFDEEEEMLVAKVRAKYSVEREVIVEVLEVMEAAEDDDEDGSLV